MAGRKVSAASPRRAEVARAAAVVQVTVAVPISGLRDGVPWPPVGGRFDLPADEAARYAALGYVVAD